MKTCMACGAPMETDESICTACGLEQTVQRFLSREHYQTWNRETAEQRDEEWVGQNYSGRLTWEMVKSEE